EVADHLSLRLLLGEPRLIDVRALPLVAADQPFFGHDLEHLQDGGVPGKLGVAHRVVHFAHRAGATLPQYSQNFQLRIGRTRRRRLRHDGSTPYLTRPVSYYEALRIVNEILRSRGENRKR